jgi:hypothetical protein
MSASKGNGFDVKGIFSDVVVLSVKENEWRIGPIDRLKKQLDGVRLNVGPATLPHYYSGAPSLK